MLRYILRGGCVFPQKLGGSVLDGEVVPLSQMSGAFVGVFVLLPTLPWLAWGVLPVGWVGTGGLWDFIPAVVVWSVSLYAEDASESEGCPRHGLEVVVVEVFGWEVVGGEWLWRVLAIFLKKW